jgi:hypothetical protein
MSNWGAVLCYLFTMWFGAHIWYAWLGTVWCRTCGSKVTKTKERIRCEQCENVRPVRADLPRR